MQRKILFSTLPKNVILWMIQEIAILYPIAFLSSIPNAQYWKTFLTQKTYSPLYE